MNVQFKITVVTHSCRFGLWRPHRIWGSLRLFKILKFGHPSYIIERRFRCILGPPVSRSAKILRNISVVEPWSIIFFKDGKERLVISTPSHLYRANSLRLVEETRRRRKGQIKMCRVVRVGRCLRTTSSSSWASWLFNILWLSSMWAEKCIASTLRHRKEQRRLANRNWFLLPLVKSMFNSSFLRDLKASRTRAHTMLR